VLAKTQISSTSRTAHLSAGIADCVRLICYDKSSVMQLPHYLSALQRLLVSPLVNKLAVRHEHDASELHLSLGLVALAQLMPLPYHELCVLLAVRDTENMHYLPFRSLQTDIP
jgi:hypothetical protein